MRKRYEFRINPPSPARKDIEKYKDFDGLLERYQKENKGQTLRRLLWTASSLAAALAGWFLLTGLPLFSTYEEQAAAYFVNQPYIAPPFPQTLEKDFSRFSINASQGGILTGSNGTRLHVPSEAFQDESGNAIQGEVAIRYREMHDFVDFFLAGVPMSYDSAGTTYQLESAGMMEIYAEQNGKRLQMRPGRAIEVELVSEVSVTRTEELNEYNIYRLDTTQRNWVFEDTGRIIIVETFFPELDEDHPLCTVQESFQIELAALESAERLALSDLERELALPPAPLRPQRHNGTDFVFDFDLSALLQDPQAHSLSDEQLGLLRDGTLWQLHPNETIDRTRLARQWEDVQLQPINNRDFRLTLLKGGEQLSVVVNPVLSGDDYEQALTQYEINRANYDQLATRRQELMRFRQDSIRAHFAEERNQLDTRYDEAWASAESKYPPIRHKVINRFKATELGIWNCDRPLTPEMAEVKARFRDEEGRALRNRIGYLVDNSRNTITRFYTGRIAKLPIDPESDQLIWMLTDEQKLAVCRPDATRQFYADADNSPTLVMDVIDRPMRSEADVREALYSSL
jgi:hypothetical protein